MLTIKTKSLQGRDCVVFIENNLQDFIVDDILNITSDKMNNEVLQYIDLVNNLPEESITSVRLVTFEAVEFVSVGERL